jgi:O-antigen/teichoic acid export membrane protein
VVGGWIGAFVALRNAPYPVRLRYEKGALREYASFSWPILLSSASGMAIAQIPVLVAQRHLGTAAVGAITLAGTISLYANRVDDIVTQTLYPAIARVRDRAELMFESFTKSNRLAMLWGVPCGVGVALFAGDLVHFVIGERWRFAVPVIQLIALTAGFNQFAFNWTAFYRALGRTRAMAIAGVAMLAAVIALAVPLIFVDGVRGYAIGMAGATAALMALRIHYILELFPSFPVVRHLLRGLAPTAPAAAVVAALRAVESSPRSGAMAAVEVVLFTAVVIVATYVSERELLREVAGYLRGRPAPEPAG